ncbi:MAG: MoaD/ThiS family protein [Candidatus Wukongarchaeota archaeon]|nr:MoaD/ThiS family protein [Candidatus Wukongarchaeota archaeon]
MTSITVKYLMVFSQITQKREEVIPISKGMTLQDLINLLYAKYGRRFKKVLGEDLGHRSALITINSKVKEKSYILNPGDEILISHIAGGG